MNTPEGALEIEALLTHEAWLRRLAAALVGDAAAADDAVQDTWIAASHALRGWLRRVLVSRLRSTSRTASPCLMPT